jgi:putative transposase
MLKAYKYRIYPNQDQKELLAKIFGQVRFVYNLGLETKISAYTGNKKHLSCFDLNKQVTQLKNECEWLKESPSQALQMSINNLDNAYTNFFRGAGFPKFKNKYSKQSFQLPQGIFLSENKKQIFIPKLKFTDIDLHREFKGEIKTVTISKTTTNKYFISILVETLQPKPEKQPIKLETTVGIDLAIKDFAITLNL